MQGLCFSSQGKPRIMGFWGDSIANRRMLSDYALTFRTLAAQTGWDNDPLKLLFRKGLTTELQSELACRDEGRTLEQFIELAICIDNLMRSRRPLRRSATLPSAVTGRTTPEPEPMQVGVTHLTSEERERRRRKNLCLYCGLPGHMRISCPTRPTSRGSSRDQITRAGGRESQGQINSPRSYTEDQ